MLSEMFELKKQVCSQSELIKLKKGMLSELIKLIKTVDTSMVYYDIYIFGDQIKKFFNLIGFEHVWENKGTFSKGSL